MFVRGRFVSAGLPCAALVFALAGAAAEVRAGGSLPVPIGGGKWMDRHATAASDGAGNLLVVYESTFTHPGLWSSRSTDDGLTWSPFVELWYPPDFPGRQGYAHPSLVRLPAGSYVLVYFDSSRTPGGIANRLGLARSADGTTFTTDPAGLALGWTDGAEENPHLLLDADGSLMLAYQRGSDAYVARSADAGATWDRRRTPIAAGAVKPRIARSASSGLYMVAYETPDGMGLRVETTADPYDWSGAATPIADGVAVREATPLALADGAFVVFYAAKPGADYDIYSRGWSAPTGWLPPELRITQHYVVNQQDDFQPTPLAARTPGEAHVFWTHGVAPPQAAYSYIYTQRLSTAPDRLFVDGFDAAR